MNSRQSFKKRLAKWHWLAFVMICLIKVGMSHADVDGTEDTGNLPINTARAAPSCEISHANGKKTLRCQNHHTIPYEFDSAAEIGVLNFAKNSLRKLEKEEFSSAGLINLEEINLSENIIDDIDAQSFLYLERLRQLDLSSNKISSLSLEAFGNLKKLRILKLNGNPIYKFNGDMFPASSSLAELHMSNCEIRELPKTIFHNLAGLQTLALDGNKIERLDSELFKKNNVLSLLKLNNNPFKCDCHVRFLLHSFTKWNVMPINTGSVTCSSPARFNGSVWKTVPMESLVCMPSVKPFEVSLTNQEPEDHIGVNQIFMGCGKDVAFECIVEGYPKPDIKWLKDGKDLQLVAGEGSLSRNIGGGDESHFKLEDRLLEHNDNNTEDYTHEFRKLLRIYRTKYGDMGTYTCVAKAAGTEYTDSRNIYLNFTSNPFTTAFPILTRGALFWWIWLVIVIAVLLIVLIVLLCVYFWKTREIKRQKVLKEQMFDKFKGSHAILEDGTDDNRSPNRSNGQSNSNNKFEDCDPLITPGRSGQSTRGSTRSVIPDVAQGNPEFVRSLSPEIFSPRPPPVTANNASEKRQFFARQMSEPPTSPKRNGSAMSLAQYNNNNRRPLYNAPYFHSQSHLPQHSSQTLHGRHVHHPQAFPMQPIRRPGSAMSLMNPSTDPIYGLTQTKPPHLARQFSAGSAYPSYATMRFNRNERPPSVSSYTSEPPMPLESLYGTTPGSYVTLPRNHGYSGTFPRTDSGFGRSLSPTESTYSTSSYSTLPRNTRYNKYMPGAIVYDSVGPRTTADGGSSLSLNRIGESPGPTQPNKPMMTSSNNPLDDINNGLMSPINGKVKNNRGRLGSANTPGSLRGRNDFFSFEPIQEEKDSLTKLANSDEIDQILLPKIHTPRNTLESNKYKKKPSPVVTIPPRNRKPVRTFEFPKASPSQPTSTTHVNEPGSNDTGEVLGETTNAPPIPTSPAPKKPPRSLSSLENIYEEPVMTGNVEGTEV